MSTFQCHPAGRKSTCAGNLLFSASVRLFANIGTLPVWDGREERGGLKKMRKRKTSSCPVTTITRNGKIDKARGDRNACRTE